MKATRPAPAAAWFAGLLLLTALPSAGTTILSQDLASMVGDSTDIVRGKVLSIESRWNAEQTLILTEVRIGVSESFKGRGRAEVTLEVHGGQVGDVVLDVVGSPSFALDEDVLVFAATDANGVLRLPHLGHNKFRVEQDTDGSQWVKSGHVALENLAPSLSQTVDANGRLSYSAFVRQLRAATGRSGR